MGLKGLCCQHLRCKYLPSNGSCHKTRWLLCVVASIGRQPGCRSFVSKRYHQTWCLACCSHHLLTLANGMVSDQG